MKIFKNTVFHISPSLQSGNLPFLYSSVTFALQAQSQMVCSPGTTFDRSFSDSIGDGGGIGNKPRLRSESHTDFFKPVLELGPHKTSQSLEEPMTPSVVISFEAEAGRKSRPHSLVSLSDYPCVSNVTMGPRHPALLHGRHNWSEQSRDSWDQYYKTFLL